MRGGYIIDMVAIGFGFILYYLMMIVGAYLPAKIEMNKWYRRICYAAYFIPFTLFAFLNVSALLLTKSSNNAFWFSTVF